MQIPKIPICTSAKRPVVFQEPGLKLSVVTKSETPIEVEEKRNPLAGILLETFEPEILQKDGLVVKGKGNKTYEILGRLGSGSFGHVFLAKDIGAGKVVAMKVMSKFKSAEEDKNARRLFEKEISRNRIAKHSNVQEVYNFGEIEKEGVGPLFFVAELINGISFDKAIRILYHPALDPKRSFSEKQIAKNPSPRMRYLARLKPEEREAVRDCLKKCLLGFVPEIIEGIGSVHDKGLIHRDITGRNILISSSLNEDTAKLIDFGLSTAPYLYFPKPGEVERVVGNFYKSRGQNSGNGEIVPVPLSAPPAKESKYPRHKFQGTYYRMAPEQLNGGAIDFATDNYNFAVVLYEILTGEVPYQGETLTDTVNNIREGKDFKPLEDEFSVQTGLAEVVNKQLTRRRKDRYFQKPSEFRRDLVQAIANIKGASL